MEPAVVVAFSTIVDAVHLIMDSSRNEGPNPGFCMKGKEWDNVI